MENKVKTQEERQQEINALNEQFKEFLHTKGIGAQFKLAFANMGESARKQREADRENFERIKAQSEEENKEFAALLRAKSFKEGIQIIIEGFKKSARESGVKTAEQIARVQAQTQANIARSKACNPAYAASAKAEYDAQSLAEEFNEFLKMKGLENKYVVVVNEAE